MKIKLVSIVIVLLFLNACSDEVVFNIKNLPTALGKSNEIVVLCDQNMWDSPMKDTLLYYFESAYPIMPSPEPLFDLRHFTYEELNEQPLRKELRTYLIVCNLKDTDSAITKLVRKDMGEERYRRALEDPEYRSSAGTNKWARNQLIIYLFADSDDHLMDNIRQSFPAIAKRVNKHDESQVKASALVTGINRGIQAKVKDKFNADIQIPADYVIAKDDEESRLLWLRRDIKKHNKFATINLVIEKRSYTDLAQFSSENVKNVINQFGKKYISSSEDGSYLQINDEDLPMFQYEQRINDNYTTEVRGIWEMVNDFMGGPFAAYMIHDSTRNEILFINTFIYAPGMSKRNLMQELDYIIKSTKINS